VFGEKVKIARKNKGFTMEQLAGLIDVSQSALSKLESGKSLPMRKTKIALAKALGDNFGEPELDQYINESETPKSKKEIIEESSVEEIFSIKFGGGSTRRTKEEILRLKRLLDRKMEQMIDES
jgi:transcriptional regulator with XRE-family HTH domain